MQQRERTARASLPDRAQKQLALGLVHEAWDEARDHGVDGDCMAQVCLFTALSELVSTYGEEAAARYAAGLPTRINNGEFSLELARQ
jgi:hypothetical protein